jgi:hypothetical protein
VIKYLPVIAVACHTILVVMIALINALYPGESSMLWGLFMLLDFPLSVALLALPIGAVESWSNETFGTISTYSLALAVVFAVVGGLQYFVLGLAARRWLNRPS